MKLDRFKNLNQTDLVYAFMDTSRGEEGGVKELHSRASSVTALLNAADVSDEEVDVIVQRLLEPTHIKGSSGRYVALKDGEFVFDMVLPQAPRANDAGRGTPPLRPLVEIFGPSVRHLVVVVDREGADVGWSGVSTPDLEAEELVEIEAEHDEISKVRVGGWSQRRYQSRVEDSWERNAEAVAAAIDSWVAKLNPELILLSGDIRSSALVKKKLGRPASLILKHFEGATRADGVNQEALDAKITACLEEFRDHRLDKELIKLEEGLGRHQGAVEGTSQTFDALSKGQADRVFISPDVEDSTLEATLIKALETDAEVYLTSGGSFSVMAATLRWE